MSFLITTSWDDGHPSDLRLAELLDRYGIRGTFYTPLRSQRPVLSAAELRSIAKQFELGAHGIDHVPLTSLPPDQALQQIVASKQWIEELTGATCRVFCPPLGRFNRQHLAMIKQANFGGFRTVELGSLNQPEALGGLHAMATTMQVYPHTKRTLILNSLRRLKLSRAISTAIASQPLDWFDSTANWLERAKQAGGVFHLWGHSWEIDELGWWPQLELVLKLCRDHIDQGHARTITNSELISS